MLFIKICITFFRCVTFFFFFALFSFIKSRIFCVFSFNDFSPSVRNFNIEKKKNKIIYFDTSCLNRDASSKHFHSHSQLTFNLNLIILVSRFLIQNLVCFLSNTAFIFKINQFFLLLYTKKYIFEKHIRKITFKRIDLQL